MSDITSDVTSDIMTNVMMNLITANRQMNGLTS